MYDTVNFQLDNIYMRDRNPFTILNYLSDVTERNDSKGYSCSGRLSNYILYINDWGVIFKGSLSSFLLGNNLYSLSLNDTRQAIEKFSDALHIDLSNSKINRFDISASIEMSSTPSLYFPFLGDKRYFHRYLRAPESLYYENKQRELVFYDKLKEMAKKKIPIPTDTIGKNILRYEYRFMKNLKTHFKTPIQLSTLTHPDFFNLAIQEWNDEYDSIQKITKSSNFNPNIRTPRDAEKALFASLLQQADPNTITNYINGLKIQKTFSDLKDYSRLKSKLKELQVQDSENQPDLLNELETKIKNNIILLKK